MHFNSILVQLEDDHDVSAPWLVLANFNSILVQLEETRIPNIIKCRYDFNSILVQLEGYPKTSSSADVF